jgi:MerR family transcriptional regulator, light-induced transcriptional regulator
MESNSPTVYLSTVQAASILAVSVSTVKRWVDEGILPAHVTAGGHRKLLRSEVIALLRDRSLPRTALPVLALPGIGTTSPKLHEVTDALFEALNNRLDRELKPIIQQLYLAAVPIEAIADEVIAPLMAKVGRHWETGAIDVWQEHRWTQLCTEALLELKETVEPRAEQNRPLALGGAPAGDPYTLASFLAELALLDNGWQVENLGANTPLPSFTKAIQDLKPRLVWVSASYLADVPQFLRDYQELANVAESLGVSVVVGGPALVESVRTQMRYHSFGERLADLVAVAQVLHPRPRIPRRGRPASNLSVH